MSDAYDTDTITLDGRKFLVSYFVDSDHVLPWAESQGHGEIREACATYDNLKKKPGERVIHSPHGTYWVYDFQGAIKKAKLEAWGLSDEDHEALKKSLERAPTKNEITVAAVEKDIYYCSGYLNDDWYWSGVGVQIVGADGEPEGDVYHHAVWGLESIGDCAEKLAHEIAGEILGEKRTVWRAALKEARAKKYWACRGVETVGA